jgi:hypothetical protein
LQVKVAAGGVVGVVADPGQLCQPVAVNTAMIAASRRAANDLPWQALFSSGSSTLVKTGTAVTVTFGARSRAIGSGSSSSAARHLKNCRSARNWMLA